MVLPYRPLGTLSENEQIIGCLELALAENDKILGEDNHAYDPYSWVHVARKLLANRESVFTLRCRT